MNRRCHTEAERQNISLRLKGHPVSEETRRKLALAHIQDEKAIKPNSLHRYLESKYGKPQECEVDPSHKAENFQWANLTGNYSRKREDYVRMCPQCHKKYDMNRLQIQGLFKSERLGERDERLELEGIVDALAEADYLNRGNGKYLSYADWSIQYHGAACVLRTKYRNILSFILPILSARHQKEMQEAAEKAYYEGLNKQLDVKVEQARIEERKAIGKIARKKFQKTPLGMRIDTAADFITQLERGEQPKE